MIHPKKAREGADRCRKRNRWKKGEFEKSERVWEWERRRGTSSRLCVCGGVTNVVTGHTGDTLEEKCGNKQISVESLSEAVHDNKHVSRGRISAFSVLQKT